MGPVARPGGAGGTRRSTGPVDAVGDIGTSAGQTGTLGLVRDVVNAALSGRRSDGGGGRAHSPQLRVFRTSALARVKGPYRPGSGYSAGAFRRSTPRAAAPRMSRMTTANMARSESIWTVATRRAGSVLGVMSPNPTVENTVTVK